MAAGLLQERAGKSIGQEHVDENGGALEFVGSEERQWLYWEGGVQGGGIIVARKLIANECVVVLRLNAKGAVIEPVDVTNLGAELHAAWERCRISEGDLRLCSYGWARAAGGSDGWGDGADSLDRGRLGRDASPYQHGADCGGGA